MSLDGAKLAIIHRKAGLSQSVFSGLGIGARSDDSRMVASDPRKRLGKENAICIESIELDMKRIGPQPDALDKARNVAESERQYDLSVLEFDPMQTVDLQWPPIAKLLTEHRIVCLNKKIALAKADEMQPLAVIRVVAPRRPCIEKPPAAIERRLKDHIFTFARPAFEIVIDGNTLQSASFESRCRQFKNRRQSSSRTLAHKGSGDDRRTPRKRWINPTPTIQRAAAIDLRGQNANKEKLSARGSIV